jgi:hypothetical protein
MSALSAYTQILTAKLPAGSKIYAYSIISSASAWRAGKNLNAEQLGSFETDDELELGGLFYRQIGGGPGTPSVFCPHNWQRVDASLNGWSRRLLDRPLQRTCRAL